MIRTKDLVLFLVIVIFLLIGITYTLARQPQTDLQQVGNTFAQVSETPTGGAVARESEIDRASIIDRLRTALDRDTSISVSPSVVDDAVTEPMVVASSSEVTSTSCVDSVSNALQLARIWPRTGVQVTVIEGVRVVRTETQTISTLAQSASTSAPPLEPNVTYGVALLRLPLTPVPLEEPVCIASDVIGVTIDGNLLFNSDALALRTNGVADLIGYARDGYPIYGTSQALVDECGGYSVGGQYRYTISPDRSTFLNCYTAVPARFSNE